MSIGFRGVITFTTHDRMVCHGWLTRIAPGAALGGRMPIVANVRLRFARAIRFTATAGLRQPLLVHDIGPLKNSNIRGAQTDVLQERRTVSPPWFGNRAGKHRAFVAERGCSHATGGLRPPLLVVLRCGHLPAKLRLVRYTNARFPGAAGVSPPWYQKPHPQWRSVFVE
jgi:hypothetical protein